MKKLLCAAFAVLVLAGCSGGAKTETKTCSMEQSGMKMDATFTAEDDKITKTSVKVTMDLSAAGLGDTELTDDQKKQLETAVLSQLGVEEGKGVNVSAEFKDKNIIATVDVDMKDGDSAAACWKPPSMPCPAKATPMWPAMPAPPARPACPAS